MHSLPNLPQPYGQNIKFTKGLETLSLDLNTIQYVQQDDFSPLFLQKILIQNSKTLKSLSLRFSPKNFQVIKAFIFALKHLKTLSILSLDFSNCQQVNDETLKDLASSLSRCSGLGSLNIKLCYSLNITSKGRKFLDKALRNLGGSLKNINLDFRYSANIANKDLVDLSKSLERCPRAVSLKLAWAGCKNIEASGVKALSKSMGELKSLRNLSLGLVDIPSVTDQELEDLSKVFNKMNDLESIELNFKQKLVRQADEMRKISDRGMHAILKILKDNKGLMTLLLNFKECYEAGEKMIKMLALALKECVCLKRVKLNFGCQGNVNRKVIQEFCNEIEGLNLLSQNVDLGICRDVENNQRMKKRDSLFKLAARNLAVV